MDELIDRSGKREPNSDLRALLVELVKAALVSDPGFVASCRVRALAAQARLGDAEVAPDDVWSVAVRQVEADPEVMRREDVNPMLPTACPLAPGTLSSADFDFDEAARVIRESSSFG